MSPHRAGGVRSPGCILGGCRPPLRLRDSPPSVVQVASVSTFFADVELVPGDPILGLSEAYNADPRATKVNLGVGIYYDETGRIPVLDAVREVEQRLAQYEDPIEVSVLGCAVNGIGEARHAGSAPQSAVYLPGLAMRPQEHQSTTEGNTQ